MTTNQRCQVVHSLIEQHQDSHNVDSTDEDDCEFSQDVASGGDNEDIDSTCDSEDMSNSHSPFEDLTEADVEGSHTSLTLASSGSSVSHSSQRKGYNR